jgi:hypothetical protein
MYVIQKIFEFAHETPDAPAFVYNLRPIGYRDFYRMISAAPVLRGPRTSRWRGRGGPDRQPARRLGR